MNNFAFRLLPSVFRRIYAQCTKELTQLRRDHFSVVLVFLMPLLTVLLYGFAVRLVIKEVPLVVQDFDQSPLSRAYIERVVATNRFKLESLPLSPSDRTQDFSYWSSSDPTLNVLDHGIAKVALVIPPDFSRRIKADKTSTVQVLVDGTDVNNTRVIETSIRATSDFFVSKAGLQPGIPRVAAQVRLWFNPGVKEYHYIVPGAYALVLWVYPAILAALSMAREKEDGTIIQVYASRLSATELLLGKGIAYFLVAIGQTLFIMNVGSLLFELPLVGDPIPLLIGTPVFLMSSVMFGLFLGIRANTRIAAFQGVTILGYLTTSFLSGIYHPLRNIPFPLSLVSNVLPARYYIELTRDAFVRGTGWAGVWPVHLVLTLLGLLLFTAALRALRQMQMAE